MFRRFVCFLAAACAVSGAVRSVQITERAPVLNGTYERIVGRVHFGMNPKLAANRIVRDLDLAQLNAARRGGKRRRFLHPATHRPRKEQRNRALRSLEPRRQGHVEPLQPGARRQRFRRRMGDEAGLHAGVARLGVGHPRLEPYRAAFHRAALSRGCAD